jgi:hypothetical protein
MMNKVIMKRMTIVTLLCVLALNSCSNPLLEQPSSGGETALPQAGIPDGFGAVELVLFQGAARTIMPQPDLAALYLEYWFARDGKAAEEKTPDGGGKVILEPGTYSLTVKAFVDGDHNDLAAQGSTDADFTVVAGVADTVGLALRPVASGEGTGSLDFSLSYPAGTVMESFTLTRIAGEEPPLDLTGEGTASGAGPVVFSGTKGAIPVGYYLLRLVLRDAAGAALGRTEAAHIYRNLTAEAAYAFEAGDFGVYWVANAADAGPGSLRQAISTVNSLAETDPQVIRVMLEPGSVIELESALPVIDRSIAIEGNGVTLTRSASWTAVNNSSQLLRIYSSAVASIRGVHFKNGLAASYGGAVQNYGTLTLESCIFSGNRTTESYALGGAIFSNNTLSIRGCTFYGNTSSYSDGAVYFSASGKTLTLTGNLFYGNTAAAYNPVVYINYDGTVAASHNVVDVAFGMESARCGWARGTGDTTFTALGIGGNPFDTASFAPDNGLKNVLPPTAPAGFPLTDFYGNTRTFPGAPGAVAAAP